MGQADDDWDNSGHIPDAAAYPGCWQTRAAAFRDGLGARARLGLSYGPDERHRYDLFLPDGPPRGVVVFVHGGYWRRFDRTDWSHLAAGPLGRGVAVAIPSYTLAPEARIATIGAEIRAAITVIAAAVPGPVALTGHSAGGQLVARAICAGAGLPDNVQARLSACVPISPVADLAPLMETGMNADLRIDAAEARAESPMHLAPVSGIPVGIWVGADERPAFVDQARQLGHAWGASVTVVPERHHFDIIDALADGDAALMSALGLD